MAKASSSKSGRGSSSSTIASTKRLATDKCTKAGGTYESYRKARVSEHKKVKKASQISLDRQLEWPLYILAALLVCHALSGTGSLSLAGLSAHLPSSIQRLLPAWARLLPNFAPFASDLPNSSHNRKDDYKSFSRSSTEAHSWYEMETGVGQAGPFRSEATGFGHPLSALHTFTRACFGLSYAIPEQTFSGEPTIDASQAWSHIGSTQPATDNWTWLIPQPGLLYSKGVKDILFVFTWILLWTALRAALMRFVFLPLGSRWVAKPNMSEEKSGSARQLRKEAEYQKAITRFAEQCWSVVFYIEDWSFGMYLAYHSDYWLDTTGFWTEQPLKELPGLAKYYYLTQCGFWFHQLIVVNVEEHRKDFAQMLAHHVITILLISGSYATHYTRVGNAILCLMDPSDILLSLAKCLKYAGFQAICDVAFAAFFVSWVVTRHWLFGIVIWDCYKSVPQSRYRMLHQAAKQGIDASSALFSGNSSSSSLSSGLPNPKDMSWSEFLADADRSRGTLTVLLVLLQLLMIGWLLMILRVLLKMVQGSEATDTRSEAELSEDEERRIQAVEEREENMGKNGSVDANEKTSGSSSQVSAANGGSLISLNGAKQQPTILKARSHNVKSTRSTSGGSSDSSLSREEPPQKRVESSDTLSSTPWPATAS